MKNVLRKRLPRFLKRNLGIYGGIALFIILVIALSAAYVVGNQGIRKAFHDMEENNRLEDGFFALSVPMDKAEVSDLLGDSLELEYQPYADLLSSDESEIRVFKMRQSIDIPFVLEGSLPDSDNEIALDRLYCEAHDLDLGDKILVGSEDMEVSGIIGLPEYIVSFKELGDLLADREVFGVSIVSDGFFSTLDEEKMTYQYAYKFKNELTREEVNQENRDIIKKLGDKGVLSDFCAIGDNNRVNNMISKMELNINMATYFMVLAMVIVAFLFALVSVHTFEDECSFVGVLIATGYKKKTILRHYLTIPVLVTLISTGIGMALALSFVYKLPTQSVYDYYVCPKMLYTIDPVRVAFMIGFPILAVILINLIVFGRKLNLTPLRLIRRDTKKEKRVKNAHEMKKLGFLNRFRVRTVVRSKGQYISLIIGVFLAGLLCMFGLGMRSSFDKYIDSLPDSAVSEYQYVLKAPLPDPSVLPSDVEKDTISTYETEYNGRMLPVNVLGISSDTKYLKDFNVASLGEDEIIISDIMAAKLGIHKGDTIELDNKLTLHKWNAKIVEVADFELGVYVFTSQETLNTYLEKEEGYYNTVFADGEISGIDERFVSTVVTKEKVADSAKQMKTLMASLIVMLTAVGIICYVIVMFMLTKMVIDKNALNISLLKVFGYRNKEVNKLYLSQTQWIIILSVILFLPLQYFLIGKIWPGMLNSMSGFFYFRVTPLVMAIIVVLGTATCLITNAIHVKHVRKIDMTEALKNRE
ncbi:MAG: FtsX-like permease family protein [Clostridiales bacterium]|nr:FtsX-like permease family protein [Clostridiales bacterium]